MSKFLIYIIEDDEDINQLVAYNLRKEGFEVKSFLHGKDALKELEKEKPDIILLDIMLPDIDGFDICKTIRSSKDLKDIPIIMLTAKDTEIDKVVGLELGADDYITKPFSFRELIARIKAVLRRYNMHLDKPQKQSKHFYLDKDTFSIVIKGKKIPLTKTEFKLLNLLVSNPRKVFEREQLLEKVWGEKQYDVYDRTIDVHIKKLREKLGEFGKKIKTVRGIGYKWEE